MRCYARDLTDQSSPDPASYINNRMEGLHECPECGQKFGFKSSMTRHRKTHEPRSFKCPQCYRCFTLKHQLDRHKKIHFYPQIPLYRVGEVRLKNTEEADCVWKLEEKDKVVQAVWRDPKTAEVQAKKIAQGHVS